MYSYKGNSSEIAKRYVYIMQYVDAKEAERLGLKGLNFYSNGEYKGFDLEGKLNSLNDSGRIVLAKFLGLYGAKRRNKTQVAKDLNWEAATNAIANFVDFVLPNLTLSTGAFQNALGLACTTEDGIHKYQKGQFKNIDVTLQMRYLLSVMATDSEREVLKNYGNKDVLIYIMRKYFIKDNKELSEYLVIPMPEIEATFK
jgi:hypothetical protein